jgi:hypothetical protein
VLFTTRPVAYIVSAPVLQLTNVNVPEQVLFEELYNAETAFVPREGDAPSSIVIVMLSSVATNLYHTDSFQEFPVQHEGCDEIPSFVLLAPVLVPETHEPVIVGSTVKVVAVQAVLFDGCARTILYAHNRINSIRPLISVPIINRVGVNQILVHFKLFIGSTVIII